MGRGPLAVCWMEVDTTSMEMRSIRMFYIVSCVLFLSFQLIRMVSLVTVGAVRSHGWFDLFTLVVHVLLRKTGSDSVTSFHNCWSSVQSQMVSI